MDLKPLEALGAHVAASVDASLDAAHDDALRVKLAERATLRKPRAARSRRGVLVPAFGVSAAVAVSAAFLVVPSGEPPPLAFTVGTPGRPGAFGEAVAAPETSGTSLRFSEGSRVALDPRARMRVARTSAAGAELVLDGGRAHVDVVPRAGNAWRVQSGPFVVDVTGTRFDLEWDANADRFSLALYEGKVTVSGCAFGAGQRLVAGERAEASCGSNTRSVRALAAPAVASERSARQQGTNASVPPHVAKASASATASVSGPHATQASAPDWPALARSGRYADAYALASASGVSTECARRGGDEVLLLGETARLSGHVDDARLAYRTVRQRFAGSTAAAQAAFQLGRLDVLAGNRGASASWFETYLREQPAGPLASAALGRLLEARVELGDTRGARETARLYLERYPTGPHADSAHKILETKP